MSLIQVTCVAFRADVGCAIPNPGVVHKVPSTSTGQSAATRRPLVKASQCFHSGMFDTHISMLVSGLDLMVTLHVDHVQDRHEEVSLDKVIEVTFYQFPSSLCAWANVLGRVGSECVVCTDTPQSVLDHSQHPGQDVMVSYNSPGQCRLSGYYICFDTVEDTAERYMSSKVCQQERKCSGTEVQRVIESRRLVPPLHSLTPGQCRTEEVLGEDQYRRLST